MYNIFTIVVRANDVLDFRMRYAQEAWEKERNGWRSVVQLNIVRSITTILNVMEAELNGDVPAESDDDERTQVDDDNNNDEEVRRFTDRHQLLMIRLAPLRGVEAELKHRLGAGSEPVQPALSMTATPFEDPSESRNFRRTLPEFSVRSWKEVLDPEERPQPVLETKGEIDSATLTISGCKNDMKELWDDKCVRLALKRRKLRLPDSAGL